MSDPVVPARLRRPTVPDAELWGPYLRQCWAEGPQRYAEEARAARDMMARAPHGTFARACRWALEGVDPGPPDCPCCLPAVPAEA